MESERTHCPVCGHDFYERPPEDKVICCPHCKLWVGTGDELIGPDDDYLWCY